MEATVEKTNAKLWNKNFILILIAHWMLCTSFSMINPCLPLYGKSMGISADIMGLIIGVATIAAMLMRPISGNAADKKNKKHIIIIGLIINALAVFLYILTGGVISLLIVRIIQGIGYGIYTTLSSTIVFDSVPSNRMAEGIGIFGLGAVFAMAVGPSVGLMLVGSDNFHLLFLGAGILIILSLIFTLQMDTAMFEIKPIEKKSKEKGSIIDALVEIKAIPAGVLAIMIGLMFNAIISFVPLYAEYRGVTNIGVFFTAYAAILLISRPLSGKIADKKGFGYVLIPGFICLFFSMIVLYIANQLSIFIIAAILFGIGIGCSLPTTQAMAAKNVAQNRRGSAMSTFYIGSDIGQASGGALAGFFATAIGYNNMYLPLTIPALLGILIYFIIFRKKKSKA